MPGQLLLEYDAPLTHGTVADRFFGQPSFSENTPNNPVRSAQSLSRPYGVSVDAQGNLLVAELQNNRVMRYDVPASQPAPVVANLSPGAVAPGGGVFTLTVNGANFVLDLVVRINGHDRPTTFLSSTRLQALISANEIAGDGPYPVVVFTPAPPGGTTTLVNLPALPRAAQDVAADTVFGQPRFSDVTPNNPNLAEANRLANPAGVAIYRFTGRLFLVDSGNNRVLSWPSAAALANGQAADLIIGQPNDYTTLANSTGRNAHSLSSPAGVALDFKGNLYVADAGNNRVLEYSAPLHSGQSAHMVFGQGGSFTTGLANNGSLGPNSLSHPAAVAVDGLGNVFIADQLNNRVLEYDTPLGHDTTADRVIGQADAFHNLANNGHLDGLGLNFPNDVRLDTASNLYVADAFNNRVLEYDAPLATHAAAERVFGQPSLVTNTVNTTGLNASGLNLPVAVALDTAGDLFVADQSNNRILEYDAPLTSSRAADRVIGQPGFNWNTANLGGVTRHGLSGPNGLDLNNHGDLFVADLFNNRLLEYDRPLPLLTDFLPLMLR